MPWEKPILPGGAERPYSPWAKVPDGFWNRKSIRGKFLAEDRGRQFVYTITFDLATRLLSEELYQREVVIQFERSKAHAPA